MEKQIILISLQEPHKWDPMVVTLPATIGRSERTKFVINHESVSGEHAQLSWDNGLYVQDLGSTNGTRLQGERIADKTLVKDSDIVGFGSQNYMVKYGTEQLPRFFFPEEQRTVALAMLPFHIGRNEDNSLTIPDKSISGRHLSIESKQNAIYISDHESTNGTRINGRRIREAVIQDGDTLTIGKVKAVALLKDTVPQGYSLRTTIDGQEKTYPIQPQQTKIGRTSENDIVIALPSVSSNHALIYWSQGRYWIKDLDSRNGTYVAGIRISESPLRVGDEIKIGKHPLLFINPQETQANFYLVMVGGERGGEEFVLNLPQMQIGRIETCAICLPDNSVSKAHALLELKQGKYTIQDLQSTNGVFINGQRVPSATLNHGDTIKIGEYNLVFRDASQLRPESLVEESFVLMESTSKGYGATWNLQDTCSIGSGNDNTIMVKHASIMPHHAVLHKGENGYILNDCGGSPVSVNREQVHQHLLEHGDEIQIGIKKYIFKSTLRPLEIQTRDTVISTRVARSSTPQPVQVALSLATLVLFVLLMAIAVKFTETPTPIPNIPSNNTQSIPPTSPDLVNTPQPNNPTPISTPNVSSPTSNAPVLSQASLQEQKRQVLLLCRQFRYPEAKQLIIQTRSQLSPNNKNEWELLSNLVNTESLPFYALVHKIRRCPTIIKIDCKSSDSQIAQTQTSAIVVTTQVTENEVVVRWPNKKQEDIPWSSLSGIAFCQLLEQSRFSEESPIAAAQWAYRLGQAGEMEAYLASAWEATSDNKARQQFVECFAQLSQKDIPDHGWIVYQSRFYTPQEFQAKQLAEQKRLLEEKQRREREYLLRQRGEVEQPPVSELAQREQAEFTLQWAVIDDLARTYEYQKAITKLVDYQKQLQATELKEKLQQRLERIQPQNELFKKLITYINKDRLSDDLIEFSSNFKGKINWADEEQFQVAVANGAVKYRWYSLAPRKMFDFFKRMNLEAQDYYQLGIFSLENGLFEEGNRSFIQAIAQDKKWKEPIDQYLAKWLEIPVPEGGFVPYQGLLITKDEREQRQKGLVRYGKEWVTPEDKEKLVAGLVRYKEGWISPGDKALLNKGYIKYQERWYTQEELNKLRTNWEHAWTFSTTHYDLRTNISEPFIQELGKFLEAAFVEYGKFFGNTTNRKMTVFAFRTYEDYRDFCMKNGATGQLRAGGFAHSLLNTGVAWMRSDTKQILEVLIHEGAHLYQFNACPNLRAPSWYAEAIATQFEGYRWDGKNLTVHGISKSRLVWLQNRLHSKNYIPLAELWQKNGLELVEKDPEQSMNFYAQSWGLFYYLSHCPDTKVRDQFMAWFKKMNNGEFNGRESQAVSDIMSKLPNLENNWKTYILDLKESKKT